MLRRTVHRMSVGIVGLTRSPVNALRVARCSQLVLLRQARDLYPASSDPMKYLAETARKMCAGSFVTFSKGLGKVFFMGFHFFSFGAEIDSSESFLKENE